MNYISRIALGALSLLLLASSCSKQSDAPELPKADLRILEAKTFLPVTGGSYTLRTDNAPAQAYALDSWLKVSAQGSTLSLEAEANTSIQSRNTLLVLKDAKGDSLTVNFMQEGVIFGLPKEQAMIGGDQAIARVIRLAANVPVTYSASADWITVQTSEKELRVSVPANASGAPRTGWVIARSGSLIDSLQVTQASLNDIIGTYQQTALELDGQKMVSRTSSFQIDRVSDTKARLTIAGEYVIEADFTPGQGITLFNGRVGKTSANAQGKSVYHVSVLAADDFTFEHKNTIIGTRESVRIAITREGKLAFEEVERLASEQRWASYGFVTSSSDRITQGTYTGIDRVFIQPVLTK